MSFELKTYEFKKKKSSCEQSNSIDVRKHKKQAL